MFVSDDGRFVYLSTANPKCPLKTKKLRKTSSEELTQILNEIDFLMIHPKHLGNQLFLDYIVNNQGFDLSLVTKPHEYTDPILSLALSFAKRCLFSMNSISDPLPKIRNPYNRDFRYGYEQSSKVQTLASFYTFNRNTRLDKVENEDLLRLRNEAFVSNRRNYWLKNN